MANKVPVTMSAERAARIAAAWERFARLMIAEGLAAGDELRAVVNPYSRANTMHHAIRRGQPRGWRFRSALEAADLGHDDRPLRLSPGAPTPALPGSEQKLLLLAQRYEAGFELWHPDDRLYYEGFGEHEAKSQNL